MTFQIIKPRPERRFKHGYEREGVEHDPHVAADQALAKLVGDHLTQHYPDHFWVVWASHKQGIVTIAIPVLMGPTAKYALHIDKIDRRMLAVMRAGGEILERYRIPRSGLANGVAEFAAAKTRHRIILPNDPWPV